MIFKSGDSAGFQTQRYQTFQQTFQISTGQGALLIFTFTTGVNVCIDTLHHHHNTAAVSA